MTTTLESALDFQITAAGLADGCERQYPFLPGRRFRADFAWPRRKLIVETDGGIYMRGGRGGGHNTGTGYERDRRRDALAMLDGWRVLRVTSSMITDGFALECIERILKHE